MAFEITRGKKLGKGVKVVVYGIEGIGKSTLASNFPDPVFIDTEGSTTWMDIARLNTPTSWDMLLQEIGYVINNPSICKTLVIDTIDWAQKLCVEHVCKQNGKSGIEDFGYGNGYTYVYEAFGRLLNGLDEVTNKGIHVVLNAHAAIRTFTKPDEMGTFDRYELKLINTPKVKITEAVKEWADMILFANYKTILIKADDKDKKSYAAGGERKMYTQHAPSYDAKNRFGLPEELPFEYSAIAHIFTQQTASQPAKPVSSRTDNILKKVEEAAAPVKVDVVNDVKPAQPEREVVGMGDFIEPLTAADRSIIAQLPKSLGDLMLANNVKPAELQKVVGLKGHFPADQPIETYPLDYKEWLATVWSSLYKSIEDARLLPY